MPAAAPRAPAPSAPAAAFDADRAEIDTILDKIAVEVTRLIQHEAALVARHPNASIYQSLHRLLDLEGLGYYLESRPCLLCAPWAQVPMAVHKLEQLRAEAKFTDSAHLVKLVCAHTIQHLTVSHPFWPAHVRLQASL